MSFPDQPVSPRTNVTSPTTQAPLPEVEAVQDILLTMKGALNALGVSWDALCSQYLYQSISLSGDL